MELMPYEDFKSTETIQYGTAATSASANHAPLFIKKELNNLYNFVKVRFSEDPLMWDARQTYEVGDLCVEDNVVYQAITRNSNQVPPSLSWELYDVDAVDLGAKYLSADSEEVVGLSDRNGSRMMRSGDNSTSALMTPKNGIVAWDDGISSSIGSNTNKFADIYVERVQADEINGTSSSAEYADLAEMYTTDVEYSAGTVLGFGGNKELTLFKTGMKVVGVVSTQPGYMLNSKIDGQYIALKGRVPCKIKGQALKGDFIIATDNGLGISVHDYNFEESKILLGTAISDSKDGVVEIKV